MKDDWTQEELEQIKRLGKPKYSFQETEEMIKAYNSLPEIKLEKNPHYINPKTACIRCDKNMNGEDKHTCSPSEWWRKAMVEGMKLALNAVNSCDERNFDAMYYIALGKAEFKIEELIKQYSGEKI